jgi:hypothetical protein
MSSLCTCLATILAAIALMVIVAGMSLPSAACTPGASIILRWCAP